ncbi:MAG: hybrid sensor histidine kinase/response regulator, partial [Oricola sp.]|nr:hybrid sensor histidine kinase/response regulator [Oricola sp.]
NHRVRNMLILIKGLVNQSQGQAKTIDEFADIVGSRIQSLAMAHDQITRENWSPASLHTLIETEVAAYLNEKKNRVIISGPDAMLHPTAFTTLALVFHELITNSAKHGALSDSRGSVAITIEEAPKGGLRIHWREEKGPKVSPPTRRGFGSAIIERSIPHDLGGEAQVKFEPKGLEGFFSVPAKFVDSFAAPSPSTAKRQRPAKPSELAKGKALVVEDNIIVGMEVESIVRKLGASDVVMASSVEVALRAIENNDFAYALLDVNLGDETVAPVARKLKQLAVPFIFTTGYGETAIGAEKLPKAPVIVKPYGLEDVQRALGKLG